MLENILFFEQPYPYFLCPDSLDEAVAGQAAAVLSGPLPWEARAGDVRAAEQLDLRRHYAPRPEAPAFLQAGFLDEMRGRMQTLFQAPLSADDIQVLGQRLRPGQRLGVSNDSPGLGRASYRVLLPCARERQPEDGGVFHVHAGDDPGAISRSIRPHPNLAVGLELGARSYHSVSPPERQPCTALIFNFWHQGNSPVVERRLRQTLASLLPKAAIAEDAGSPADWPAPRAAQALLGEWCMGMTAQAAGLLLTAARSGAAEAVRAPEVSAALARLGFASGAPLPSGEAIHAAAQANAGLSADPDTLRAALALAVWVASAPSRMFTHEHWLSCAAQVRPWAHRLPIRVMHLAEALFPEWPPAGAG